MAHQSANRGCEKKKLIKNNFLHEATISKWL